MHDGMVVEPLDRASRAVRMTPIGAEAEGPPIGPVLEIDRTFGLHEDERARPQHMRQRARIVFCIGRDLGEGHMAGVFDKAVELRVGDRSIIDPEAVDLDAVRGFLLGVMKVGAHGKLAAGNEHHLAPGFRLGLEGPTSPLHFARDAHAAQPLDIGLPLSL
jgi:hypothetical protein